ncbi:MAG: 2-polyprenyl-3-methyl-6-methoxy-1,4-benzoquinone monooxygenase [Pseudomonadota bacterium]
MSRRQSLGDQLVISADRALRALLAPTRASRPTPGQTGEAPTGSARTRAAELMRINHAGEIAAQGLYHGQAMVARDPAVRDLLVQAGREEADHLAWCETRLSELHDRPSRLDPLWYAGSFVIGAVAGLASDRISLGFVAETERQVERHLASHLEELPADDTRSRDILIQMQKDEQAHGELARKSGGAALPVPVRKLMQATARVMTTTARWI